MENYEVVYGIICRLGAARLDKIVAECNTGAAEPAQLLLLFRWRYRCPATCATSARAGARATAGRSRRGCRRSGPTGRAAATVGRPCPAGPPHLPPLRRSSDIFAPLRSPAASSLPARGAGVPPRRLRGAAWALAWAAARSTPRVPARALRRSRRSPTVLGFAASFSCPLLLFRTSSESFRINSKTKPSRIRKMQTDPPKSRYATRNHSCRGRFA